MTRRPRLLFLITEDWYFWSHRSDLARAARDAGMEVLIATRVQDHGRRIRNEGFAVIPIRMRRKSRNPLSEAAAILELVRLYRRERPDLVHHVAMKPMLYGSIAARLTGVPVVVNAFAGLGYVFIADGFSSGLRRTALGQALKWVLALDKAVTLFQNEEDRALLVGKDIVRSERTRVIGGAGVNTATFSPTPEPDGVPVVLLASRMLWDKGVGEFVEAVRLLKANGIGLTCALVGMGDEDNPASVPESQLRAWQAEGIVEWWGHREDMPRVLASAHVVVLPSYREGLPKVLLEAAACARPIVATDVPGCREIVRHGDNGLLIPARDPKALAEAIATLVRDRTMRVRMGARGREIVENEFLSKKIAADTIALYRELMQIA